MENTILDKNEKGTKGQNTATTSKLGAQASNEEKKQVSTTPFRTNSSSIKSTVASMGAGVILGTTGAYAMSERDMQEEENADAAVAEQGNNGVLNATTVNDDMSFNEAFAAARTEVGAGGTFEWNGKLYGTYYKDEWDSMSADEKEAYNQRIDWPSVLKDSEEDLDESSSSDNVSITSSDDEVVSPCIVNAPIDDEDNVATLDDDTNDDLVVEPTDSSLVEVVLTPDGNVLVPDEDFVTSDDNLEGNDVFEEIEVLGVDDAEPSLYAEDQEIFLIEVDGTNDIEYVAADSTPEDIDMYTSDTDLMAVDDVDYMQDVDDYDLA